jgi:hypothetical protein
MSSEMERLDRMLTLAETRRDRALRSIGDYRSSFAKRVRQSSDRILEGEDVLTLENTSGNN